MNILTCQTANFAVNSAYIARNPDKKGVGRIIFADFILPLIDEASEFIGIQILYIFALPYDSLINRYMQYGFRFLSDSQEQALHRRLKPRYDQNCRFMYIILN